MSGATEAGRGDAPALSRDVIPPAGGNAMSASSRECRNAPAPVKSEKNDTKLRQKPDGHRVRQLASLQVSASHGKIPTDLALCLVRGLTVCALHVLGARLLIDRGAAVEPCHHLGRGWRRRAAASSSSSRSWRVLASVEELLFEFGNTLTESADFVGSRDTGGRGRPVRRGLRNSRSLSLVFWWAQVVRCVRAGWRGRPAATGGWCGCWAGEVSGFGGEGEDLGA